MTGPIPPSPIGRANRGPSRCGTRRAVLFRVVRAGAVAYLLLIFMMMLLENYLIFPAPRYPRGNWEPNGLAYEDVFFESADGIRLHGWYVPHAGPKAQVLFCHGNGEHVADLAPLLKNYYNQFQVSVFAFDYRGYGRSEGRPNEQGVLADGRAALEWLARRAGCKPSELVIVGRSLGGAVAVDLAASSGARGLVLERTFTSMPDVAARIYPFLPIRLLMKTQFDSESKIGAYKGPLLQSHGTADRIVPFDIGRKLYDAAASQPKQFFPEPGRGHDDPYSAAYWDALRQFLWNLPGGC